MGKTFFEAIPFIIILRLKFMRTMACNQLVWHEIPFESMVHFQARMAFLSCPKYRWLDNRTQLKQCFSFMGKTRATETFHWTVVFFLLRRGTPTFSVHLYGYACSVIHLAEVSNQTEFDCNNKCCVDILCASYFKCTFTYLTYFSVLVYAFARRCFMAKRTQKHERARIRRTHQHRSFP